VTANRRKRLNCPWRSRHSGTAKTIHTTAWAQKRAGPPGDKVGLAIVDCFGQLSPADPHFATTPLPDPTAKRLERDQRAVARGFGERLDVRVAPAESRK
jgi:hypothetical protein